MRACPVLVYKPMDRFHSRAWSAPPGDEPSPPLAKHPAWCRERGCCTCHKIGSYIANTDPHWASLTSTSHRHGILFASSAEAPCHQALCCVSLSMRSGALAVGPEEAAFAGSSTTKGSPKRDPRETSATSAH